MKYISVIILIALLSWTWCLANGERPMRLEQHKHVEAGVEQDIRAFIQRRFPTTTELYCPQLYTETSTTEDELVVHFRCVAVGGVGADQSEQTFEGYLRLESHDGFETWSETGGEIQAKEIRFLNGIKISPKDKTKDDGSDEAVGSEGLPAQKTETKKK